MNNNFEQVTENEFDGMTMEEKKKYLIDLVSNMSGNEVETVFLRLKRRGQKTGGSRNQRSKILPMQ